MPLNHAIYCLFLSLPVSKMQHMHFSNIDIRTARPLTTCQKGMMIVQAGLCGVSLYRSTYGTTGTPATKAPRLNDSTHLPWLRVPSGATDNIGMAGLEALCAPTTPYILVASLTLVQGQFTAGLHNQNCSGPVLRQICNWVVCLRLLGPMADSNKLTMSTTRSL